MIAITLTNLLVVLISISSSTYPTKLLWTRTSLSRSSRAKSTYWRSRRLSMSTFLIMRSSVSKTSIRWWWPTKSSCLFSLTNMLKGKGLQENTFSISWPPCSLSTSGRSWSTRTSSACLLKAWCRKARPFIWANIGRSSSNPCHIYQVSSTNYCLLTLTISTEKPGKTLDLLKTKSKPIAA